MNKMYLKGKGAQNALAGQNSGFTLIELLVVVLIIGILSSVALPQYTKAVEKSRIAEAKTVLKTLLNAEIIYGLANGASTDSLSELDISIAGTYDKWGSKPDSALITNNFTYFVDEGVCNSSGGCTPGTDLLMCAERKGKNYQVCSGGPQYDGGWAYGKFWCSGTVEDCTAAGAVKDGPRENDYFFK